MNKGNSKSYLWWLAGDTSLDMSSAITGFSIPILVLLVTGSSGAAGSIDALRATIAGLTGLAGGVIVDRYSRRKVAMIGAGMSLLIYLAASIASLWFGLSLGVFIAMAVLLGLRGGLFGGATNVLLRNVVSEKDLPKAMSINQGRDAAVELAGSPLAGLLLGISKVAPFLANIGLNAVAIFSLSRLKSPHLDVNTEDDGCRLDSDGAKHRLRETISSFLKDCTRGFAFIGSNRLIRRIAITSATFFPLLNGFLLLFMLAVIERGGSPITSGLFGTAFAVGVLLGSVSSTFLVDRIPTGKLVVILFAIPPLLLLVGTLVPQLWVQLLILVPVIFLLPAGNASFGGFTMAIVPDRLLGRYFSTLQLFELMATPIVSLGVGFGLQELGFQATALLLIVLMAVSALSAITYRPIRDIPTSEHWNVYINSNLQANNQASGDPDRAKIVEDL